MVAQFSAPASCPAKSAFLRLSARPDGFFDAVVVDLNAAVGPEELQAIPVFGDVGQCLAEWRLRCNACAVMEEPRLHVGDKSR